MAVATPLTLALKITRSEPELIVPAKPTPRELKELSDIDDHTTLRFHIPMIQFYRHNPSIQGKDPAKVIKDALAQALVFYYPFAGRLKLEGPAPGKLLVNCTGEGVLFIEADADVTLDQFGDVILPPFHNEEELIYDTPKSQGIYDSPLLIIQVTRLKCGGFILGLNLYHALCDLKGLVQFLTAAAEIASGAQTPSVLPVWQRELLNARNPPRITCTHHGFGQDAVAPGAAPVTHVETTHLSFLFGPTEVSGLRRLLQPQQQQCSDFELLTACVWRCRVAALEVNPDDEVYMIVMMDARSKLSPPLPTGFYGNVLAFSTEVTTAGELQRKPLDHGVELVRKAVDVSEEYIRSFADFMVLNDRRHFTMVRSFLLMDLRGVGLEDVDFGWGKPAYGGAPGAMHGVASFFMGFKDGASGEEGLVVPICLPVPAMERFVKELNSLMGLVKDDYTVVG